MLATLPQSRSSIPAPRAGQVTITLPRLHDGQQQIKAERRRFNVLDCARRFGKDILLRDLLVEAVLKGLPVAWVEPSYPMMVECWPELVRLLRPITVHKDASEHRLELVTGAIVKLWSLEAFDAARGKKYGRVIFNEAALSVHLQAAWEEVFRATLTDYLGDAYFSSTPKLRTYFWQLYMRGQDAGQTDWMSWQMPTSANPHISPSEIEDARRDLPQRTFAQEYLAEFNEGGGSVFRRVRDCVYRDAPITGPEEGHSYTGGLDWGRTEDFTVLTVMDMETRRVVHIERFNKIDWAFQRERVKAVYQRWGLQMIVAESNSIGGPNIEALVADNVAVFPFMTTNASKNVLIERLVLGIENGTLSYPDDPVLIGELEAYEMGQTKLGTATYNAPPGQHDDCVMSLALCVWGAS